MLGALSGACLIDNPPYNPNLGQGTGTGSAGDTAVGTSATAGDTASPDPTGALDTGGGTSSPTGSPATGGITSGPPPGTEETGLADAEVDTGALPPVPCGFAEGECNPGEKCNPYSAAMAGYDGAACFSVADDPVEVGQACNFKEYALSGEDNCVAGATCLDVNPGANDGRCAYVCTGGSAVCERKGMLCGESYSPFFGLCGNACNPLVQNCDAGEACYFAGEPICIARSTEQQLLEPCTLPNDCALGLTCISNDALSTCEAERCCTSFCDIDGSVCGDGSGLCEPLAITGQSSVGICIY